MIDSEMNPLKGRHTILASNHEHREQLLSDLFNRFETVEESDDLVVLKRRSISFKEQSDEERSVFHRFMAGLAAYFLMVGGSSAWPEPSEREKSEIAALPPGTEVIEIRRA